MIFASYFYALCRKFINSRVLSYKFHMMRIKDVQVSKFIAIMLSREGLRVLSFGGRHTFWLDE
jgi:hypothetical protein